jgi:ankyrin repeat protein
MDAALAVAAAAVTAEATTLSLAVAETKTTTKAGGPVQGTLDPPPRAATAVATTSAAAAAAAAASAAAAAAVVDFPMVDRIMDDEKKHIKNHGVTPLMLACDKAQSHCVKYIETIFLRQDSQGPAFSSSSSSPAAAVALFGHPLQKSSSQVGGNTALHYAAMSGCSQAIESLCVILLRLQFSNIENDDDDDTSPDPQPHYLDQEYYDTTIHHNNSNNNSNTNPSTTTPHVPSTTRSITTITWYHLLMKLASQRNEHLDTPIMMASASGQALFLRLLSATLSTKRLCQQQKQQQQQLDINADDNALGDNAGEKEQPTPHYGSRGGTATTTTNTTTYLDAPTVAVYDCKNQSGDTALSLALGQGHVEVVELLVEMVQVTVTYDDMARSERLLHRLEEDAAMRLGRAIIEGTLMVGNTTTTNTTTYNHQNRNSGSSSSTLKHQEEDNDDNDNDDDDDENDPDGDTNDEDQLHPNRVRCENLRHCIAILTLALDREAEANMDRLLAQEETESLQQKERQQQHQQQKAAVTSKKKKQKAKKRKTKGRPPSQQQQQQQQQNRSAGGLQANKDKKPLHPPTTTSLENSVPSDSTALKQNGGGDGFGDGDDEVSALSHDDQEEETKEQPILQTPLTQPTQNGAATTTTMTKKGVNTTSTTNMAQVVKDDTRQQQSSESSSATPSSLSSDNTNGRTSSSRRNSNHSKQSTKTNDYDGDGIQNNIVIHDREEDGNITGDTPTNVATTSSDSAALPGVMVDVEAVMNALCLNAAMLLLTDAEMAEQLSPCQLDAVDSVLQNQRDAVVAARTIQQQARLLLLQQQHTGEGSGEQDDEGDKPFQVE